MSEDGRIRLANDIVLGRKSLLFAGSERSGQHAADKHTLTRTSKLNGIDPQARPPCRRNNGSEPCMPGKRWSGISRPVGDQCRR
jgi:hypothetical protein